MRRYVLIGILFGFTPGLIQADPLPEMVLHYDHIGNHSTFPFRVTSAAGVTITAAKPAGRMEFGLVSANTQQIDTSRPIYCAEPLVPIRAGNDYRFAVKTFDRADALGDINSFGDFLASTNRKIYVRELYGRYISESAIQPEITGPAFQIALWEILHETSVPSYGETYSLYGGAFRTTLTPENAPVSVQLAEKYLQSLVGDDSSFSDNPLLQNRELVRLIGRPGEDGFVPQSQLALRTIELGQRGVGSQSPELTSFSGTGGTLGTGIGSGFSPRSPSVGGFGGFPNGGGGNASNPTVISGTPVLAPVSTNTPTTNDFGTQTGSSVTRPVLSAVTSIPPIPEPPSTNPPGTNDPNNPNNPNDPNDPNNPLTPVVPAPAPALLLLAGAIFLRRRLS